MTLEIIFKTVIAVLLVGMLAYVVIFETYIAPIDVD